MAINVLTIKTKVIDTLKGANTNTATTDLSGNLKKKVAKISGSNAEKKPLLNIHYPALFVEVKNEVDDFYLMGNSENRDVEIGIDVVAVVDYGVGLSDAREESDDELIRLSNNIQTIFRKNISLSSTVDSCLVANTNYEAEYVEDTYNSQSRISLIIKKRG